MASADVSCHRAHAILSCFICAYQHVPTVAVVIGFGWLTHFLSHAAICDPDPGLHACSTKTQMLVACGAPHPSLQRPMYGRWCLSSSALVACMCACASQAPAPPRPWVTQTLCWAPLPHLGMPGGVLLGRLLPMQPLPYNPIQKLHSPTAQVAKRLWMQHQQRQWTSRAGRTTGSWWIAGWQSHERRFLP